MASVPKSVFSKLMGFLTPAAAACSSASLRNLAITGFEGVAEASIMMAAAAVTKKFIIKCLECVKIVGGLKGKPLQPFVNCGASRQ